MIFLTKIVLLYRCSKWFGDDGMQINDIVAKQRRFYKTHKTKDTRFRREALKKLRKQIKTQESDIMEALYLDLHKSGMEAYMSEIGMVLSELTYQLRHLEEWAAPVHVKTPLAQFPAKSYTIAQPYGVVLVMSPWNYPFQLAMEPAIGAIAAGNTVLIKPSAYAPHTARVIARIVQHCFSASYVCVVEGGRQENSALLEQRFDYIFFTGSVHVGRIVMAKASRYLTPVSLELGGKSPCIIDKSANLRLAAKRIVFGKFLNAGQTCVAPDYVLIEDRVQHEFLAYLQYYIQSFYGKDPLCNDAYPCIINEKHYDRLIHLMEGQSICIGGRCQRSTRHIAPTVFDHVSLQDPIMQEEIFGPLLPILSFHDMKEAIDILHSFEDPLALYLFTKSKTIEEKILRECTFGGGCINDTIIHLATSHMGFGGVGYSGMGSYHGFASFQTFSHKRSIVKKATWFDLPVRYPPYTHWKDIVLRMFMR